MRLHVDGKTFVDGKTLVDQLGATYTYFLLLGEDPKLIAPETLIYWVTQGKNPQQIFAICCNQRES